MRSPRLILLSTFATVAVLCALFSLAPRQAWAASSSSWAPMCDLSAATVIAPMVAPPIEAGEISTCPDAPWLDDLNGPSLLAGLPAPTEPEPGLHFELPVPRVLPNTDLVVPGARGPGTLLLWPEVHAGPRHAFARLLERPPCAA